MANQDIIVIETPAGGVETLSQLMKSLAAERSESVAAALRTATCTTEPEGINRNMGLSYRE